MKVSPIYLADKARRKPAQHIARIRGFWGASNKMRKNIWIIAMVKKLLHSVRHQCRLPTARLGPDEKNKNTNFAISVCVNLTYQQSFCRSLKMQKYQYLTTRVSWFACSPNWLTRSRYASPPTCTRHRAWIQNWTQTHIATMFIEI